MTHHAQIIETFQLHGGAMSLGQILRYPWGYEFRARKTEINADPSQGYTLRLAKRSTAAPSENLYLLERKPKPGELL